MSKDTRAEIEALRAMLQQIEAHSPPDKIRSALSAAISQLERVVHSLELEREQRHQFVSHISHELRVPMTSILGYTDLLRKGVFGSLNEQQVAFLSVIRNNVERMSTLVTDLSDLSKAETGALKLEILELSLQTIIEDVARNLQPALAEKAQVLKFDLPDDLPPVLADSMRLSQVVTRLLVNANRYTPEAGQITLRAAQQGTHVLVEICDTGIGIDPAEQARLFSRFFRGDNPLVREQPGWGLSLSVCKMLIEHMGGNIGCRSNPGEGSTFWFTLPIHL